MATRKEKELDAIRGLDKIRDSGPDEFLFRFVILLIESGLMEPWMCAYNPCSKFRI